MPQVTLCVPAFRAGAFLRHTLENALAQTHQDLRVWVAIEPPGEVEAAICETLHEADPRLDYVINDRVLGWAGNIAGLLDRVDGDYFLVLPHDDFLHPEYVERLLEVLNARPDAVVAYGDIQFMDGGFPRRRSQSLEENDPVRRLASFWAAGAHAPPWRGLTRRRVLERATFPTDAFNGFLVECEWVYHLLCQGPAVRVPRTLYFKRLMEERTDRASAIRARSDLDTRLAAVDGYRERSLAQTAAALGDVPPLVRAGIELVVARRRLEQGDSPTPERVEGWLAAARAAAVEDDDPIARRLRATLLILEASRLSPARDAEALVLVERAIALDDRCYEAHRALAELKFRAGEQFAALTAVARACDLEPYDLATRELSARIESAFLGGLEA